jgi:ABC-type polysaccharide/polyol phosphate transport system ATPase subunit
MREVLKGLSLTIARGETVALIGRNGSGKSTPLSLLARVYRPTSGTVTVRGRVAPLLELGAGFHPDLIGTENIELYGAILGMSRREILAKGESIVRFAFDSPDLLGAIDTPLRNYSDGMKMRLGFSIAVHTEPDVLLVDEVLAVGDEAFQNKCYARIAEFQQAGKTIVFVSHEMPVVRRVAHRVLWLHDGALRMDGPPDEVVEAYLGAAQRGEMAGEPSAGDSEQA